MISLNKSSDYYYELYMEIWNNYSKFANNFPCKHRINLSIIYYSHFVFLCLKSEIIIILTKIAKFYIFVVVFFLKLLIYYLPAETMLKNFM